MKKGGGYQVKNVYSGAIFPPGSGQMGWHGVQPDVFDPMFEKAYREQAVKELPRLDKWSWSLITEEADHLFGLNSQAHDHMGYVVLAQSLPHRRTLTTRSATTGHAVLRQVRAAGLPPRPLPSGRGSTVRLHH